jgi:unsaturated rhamnogalacturonyl hydrolase
MSKSFVCFVGGLLAVLTGLAMNSSAQSFSSEISPKPVLDVMQRVADWQLAHPSKHKPTDWTQGAGYAGFMALAGISGDVRYREAMLDMGATNDWKLGPRKFHADDHAVGQAYCELYILYRDPKMIAPMRAGFDGILTNPSTVTSLEFTQPKHKSQELWSWCDSLFMAPPAWVRLYSATGDPRYLDFAVKEWWRTSDYLYDQDEHLYFRDSTYFSKREANGQKIFWGRGNGWVMGGLVRTLQYLPMHHPDRPRFEQQFKEMSAAVLKCQQPDGLWRASLLDPASYPLKETSGSGFYTYALAWGVNQGLLDKATYEPVVRKAWAALVACVEADGKLTHVQPIGADPKKFKEDSTEIYGVGAFLLAGSEVYRLAVLPINYGLVRVLPKIQVANPSGFYRECETVEMNNFWNLHPVVIMDGCSSRIFDSQVYVRGIDQKKGTFLFQSDFAPHETKTFYFVFASGLAAVPPPIVKTFTSSQSDTNRIAQPLKVTVGD